MKQVLVGAAMSIAALAVSPAISAESSKPQLPAQNASTPASETTLEQLKVSDVDKQNIQFVVKMHIASLSQQRADLFSKTFTEKTQDAFDTPEHMLIFFSMRYIPVVFAKSFYFDGLSLKGKVPVQHGYLVDKRGTRWRVSYGLQHIDKGDWRIISTVLKHAPGDPT